MATDRENKRAALAADVAKFGHMFLGRNLRLVGSPAWAALSDNARRVIERLEIEHMRHCLKDNGQLCCTYDDFEDWGIRRASVRLAIEEAVSLGFVEIVRRGYASKMEVRVPSLYRLTYVKTFKDQLKPTNEWEAVADERAARQAVRRAVEALADERGVKRARRAANEAAAADSSKAGKGASPGRESTI